MRFTPSGAAVASFTILPAIDLLATWKILPAAGVAGDAQMVADYNAKNGTKYQIIPGIGKAPK